MAKELHRGAFHLVHAIIPQQWWITMGKGPVNTWSILSKHNSRAEALVMWKHMHGDCGSKCESCAQIDARERERKS